MGNASVQRGLFLTFRLFSLIRHALRRATFPVGEGDLRRGLHTRGPVLVCRGPSAPKPVPPLFRRCGGTFPQGKVRGPAGVYPRFWYSLGFRPVSFLKVPEK